jgi:hypothetical protein
MHQTLLDRKHPGQRGLLDFLIGHFFLVRGELPRMAEPADMSVMRLVLLVP